MKKVFEITLASNSLYLPWHIYFNTQCTSTRFGHDKHKDDTEWVKQCMMTENELTR